MDRQAKKRTLPPTVDSTIPSSASSKHSTTNSS